MKEVGVETLNIKSNLQLIIALMKGEYEVKEPLVARYVQGTKRLFTSFDYNLQKILRKENY